MDQIKQFLTNLSENIHLDDLSKGSGTWIFRGQPEIFDKIIPVVGRPIFSSVTDEQECLTYDQFRMAFPRFKVSVGDDWEMLALAQHHGLPTRLLDWTFNPLIALFFAVHDLAAHKMENKKTDTPKADLSSSETDTSETDGIVYALSPKNAKSPPHGPRNTLAPFKFKRGQEIEKPLPEFPKRFWPKDISERVFAQEGLFVWFRNPSECLTQQKPDSWEIMQFIVPGADKAELRKQLDFLGFTHARLFPDPDGLAKTLAWRMRMQMQSPQLKGE